MSFAVIKVAGSGNIVTKGADDPSSIIPGLEYRKIRIDSDHFNTLIQGVREAAQTNKIAIVAGGMGAFLFLGWAREMGLSKKYQKRIGCALVNLNSDIILNALKRSGALVYPSLVSPFQDFLHLFKSYGILVFRSSPRFDSSDSLSAFVAAKLGAKLLLFKRHIPVYFENLGFAVPTSIAQFTVNDLRQFGKLVPGDPGRNALVDMQAVDLIEASNLWASLFNSDDIRHLRGLIETPDGFRHTRILLR